MCGHCQDSASTRRLTWKTATSHRAFNEVSNVDRRPESPGEMLSHDQFWPPQDRLTSSSVCQLDIASQARLSCGRNLRKHGGQILPCNSNMFPPLHQLPRLKRHMSDILAGSKPIPLRIMRTTLCSAVGVSSDNFSHAICINRILLSSQRNVLLVTIVKTSSHTYH